MTTGVIRYHDSQVTTIMRQKVRALVERYVITQDDLLLISNIKG
jgi:type IV pilus biogenesis protein CpaD/CtpE